MLPKNASFGALFTRFGQAGRAMSDALTDLFTDYKDVDAKVRRMRDIEHQGDRIAHDAVEALRESFITPFDREDILLLTDHLDEFLDMIEEAARRMSLYRIAAPTPEAIAFAQIIARQAAILERLMPLIEDKRRLEELRGLVHEVRALEDEGDALHDKVQVTLFDGAKDVPGLVSAIRWGEIYTLLEEATDQAQRVANTVDGILLKHA